MINRESAQGHSREIEFTWDIIYRCNYRCSYCWYHQQWDHFEKKFPVYPSWKEWMGAWTRVFKKYGPVRISISGGEPFLYPSFLDLLEGLSRMHHVFVTTNLSMTKPVLERLARIQNPGRVAVSGSFHPDFAEFQEFMGKMAFLRGKGFRGSVLVVAHPRFLDHLPVYEEQCRCLGIPLTVWVFRGNYGGVAYPEGYTPHERKRLLPFLGDFAQQRYQLERSPTQGMPCYSGQYYANVKADGMVYRCGTAAGLKADLGNLLDDGFSLFSQPSPCPARQCDCQEYRYLREEFDKVYALR